MSYQTKNLNNLGILLKKTQKLFLSGQKYLQNFEFVRQKLWYINSVQTHR